MRPVRAARGSLGLAIAIVAASSRFLPRIGMSDAPVSRSLGEAVRCSANAHYEDHLVDVLDEVGELRSRPGSAQSSVMGMAGMALSVEVRLLPPSSGDRPECAPFSASRIFHMR